MTKNKDRYAKQILFNPLGKNGQKELSRGRVVIIGVGGLGCSVANNLVRAGIGFIKIVDKDRLEISNLHRQFLYNENDLKRDISKVHIAKEKLSIINSEVIIEAIDQEVNAFNIESILGNIDFLIDCTDNFKTRAIINLACVKNGIPWVFGTAAGSYGIVLNILPKKTRCFYCIFNKTPLEKYADTSSNIGVLNTIVSTIAAIQSNEAIKYLSKNEKKMEKRIIYIDFWDFYVELIAIKKNPNYVCPVCNYRD